MHAGGIDLRFPHHCNEIAQCEGYIGKDWCSHMLHIGHMQVEDENERELDNGYSFIQGRKMSKSLKNFITISDMLKQYSSDDFRMFCMLNHYAARVQLDDNGLQQAQQMWIDMKNVGQGRLLRKRKRIG